MRDATTLPALLRARVDASPEAEALRFEDRSVTFAQLRSGALALADALRSRGVGPGDRVAVVLPNGLDVPLAWFAIVSLRAIVVPINVRYLRNDLAFVLGHSGAVAVLAGPEQRPLVDAARSSATRVRLVLELTHGTLSEATTATNASAGSSSAVRPLDLLDGLAAGRGFLEPGSEALERAGDAMEPGSETLERAGDALHPGSDPTDPGRSRLASADPVTIQYTSGTTGFPKGCVLHHGYWLRLARTIQGFTGLGPRDVLLTAQPQSYMDPTWNLVLAVLVGAPLVVLPRFSASTFWADVGRHGATFFYCIGTMPLYLLERPQDPSADRGHRVRLVYCSGIPAARHAEMERRWGCTWRETYGTTELGVVLAVRPEEGASVGSGSMGHAVPGREVTVDDDTGELRVRGPDTMLRYHDDPAATSAWSSGGWTHTGDLVRASPLGYVHVGRTKDMIRRAGENISAVEVEAVLAEHPDVRAAACIPVPDDLRGEEVKAYVLPREGTRPSEAYLHAFVSARLASFKVPRYIELVDDFPLTQSEKIAKAELSASRDDHTLGAWDASRAHPDSGTTTPSTHPR